MFIKEVCAECDLTKKAVEYYERQGIINPRTGENGYRIYEEKDIKVLKETALLRRFGISISDIRGILSSTDKSEALLKCRLKAQLNIQRASMALDCMDHLIKNYNIDEASCYANSRLSAGMVIKEKLLEAFPGSYGAFLAMHFGRFLEEPADSAEKLRAYNNIVDFLDNVSVPEDLDELLSEFKMPDADEIGKMQQSIMLAVEDAEAFVEANGDIIKDYIDYRASEDYINSPMCRMYNLLTEFNKSSGYYDIFIPNMKTLSTSYNEYIDKLDAANDALLKKYPQASALNSN